MNFVLAVMLRINKDSADRTKVTRFEIYGDEKAFQAHQQTPHFKKYVADAVPLLEARERHMMQRALPSDA
jgi:quinol monooxygenase YgiN